VAERHAPGGPRREREERSELEVLRRGHVRAPVELDGDGDEHEAGEGGQREQSSEPRDERTRQAARVQARITKIAQNQMSEGARACRSVPEIALRRPSRRTAMLQRPT
jgi:hypothetical protein